MMVRDDVIRFENEQQEKKLLKKQLQADYKSFLERQMDNHRAKRDLEVNEYQEEGQFIKEKVQKMTEQENLKRRLATDRTKAVSFENNQTIHDIHERLMRNRQTEIAQEKERMIEQQILEQEKLNIKLKQKELAML